MEILCSFRIVLEGKTGKDVPESSRLEFSEKFLANNFAWSEAENSTSGPLKRGGITDLPLVENTISKWPKVPTAKFLGSDRPHYFISISTMHIWQLQEPFATITSLSELSVRLRRFILLVQTKKVISMNYGSSSSSWKPWRWVRLDLILRWGIYTSVPTWTHSQNSLAAAEARSLKISSHGTSLKWPRRPSQSARK